MVIALQNLEYFNLQNVSLFQIKEEIELRKHKNLAELNKIDEVTHVEMEGFQTGSYLRLEVHAMPFEMVKYFNPQHLVLVGGIGRGEESVGYMQVCYLSCVTRTNLSKNDMLLRIEDFLMYIQV